MIRKSQLILAGILIVLASGAMSYAVSAAVPAAALPAGSTLYAVANASNSVTTNLTTWSNLPNMSASVVIPTGHTADVVVLVCGEFQSASQALAMRVKVGTKVFAPPEKWVRDAGVGGDEGRETGCGIFYKTGMAAGTKNVTVQWRSEFSSGTHTAWGRSMLVIANVH
jgi:hypothetical protein